jgi:hypothetical protein
LEQREPSNDEAARAEASSLAFCRVATEFGELKLFEWSSRDNRRQSQRHKRIDRPTGWAIRFFNQKENEWTEKRFGRLALAIQRRPPEVFLHFSNEKYYNIGNFS